MNDFMAFLNKNKKQNNYLTGTVSSIIPLQAKIIPTDDAINVVCTTNLFGVGVGSRILMLKFLDQFIGIAVLGNPKTSSIEIGLTSDQSITTTDYTTIEFNTETIKIGTNLSFNATNHSIVVGAGVQTIEVNLKAWAMQYAVGYSRLFLYKNGSVFGQHILPPRNSQYWATHSFSQIISVTANDEIFSKMNFGTADASNYVEGTQTRSTLMSAKVIEYDLV